MHVLREGRHTVTALLLAAVTVTASVAVAAAVAATTTATVSAAALEATAAAAALGSLVHANGTAVESEEFSTSWPCGRLKAEASAHVVYAHREGSVDDIVVTHSISFMALIAASASSSLEKRTKPKPRLRPVSRSLTTTCTYRISICDCSSTLVCAHVLQLPQQRRTPRTLCAERRRQCARQGRC